MRVKFYSKRKLSRHRQIPAVRWAKATDPLSLIWRKFVACTVELNAITIGTKYGFYVDFILYNLIDLNIYV